MTDDIDAIAKRLRETANAGLGEWLRPHELRAILDALAEARVELDASEREYNYQFVQLDDELIKARAERDAAIRERDEARADADARRYERDEANAERGNDRMERNAAIAERDALAAELKSAEASHDEMGQELAALCAELAEARAYNDGARLLETANGVLLDEKGKAIAERDALAALLREADEKLTELASDCELDVQNRYMHNGEAHPAYQRKYDRDIAVVNEARALHQRIEAELAKKGG